MAIRHRTPFAPEFNFVVRKLFTFNGRPYEPGEDFDKANVNVRMLQKLHEQHKIDAVIPSFTIQKDAGEADPEPTAPAKAKAAKKAKAEPAPAEPAPAGNRYRLKSNFGKVHILDGDTVVRECEDFEEAKAAMAELAGE